jgi:hypothetical protein
VGWLVRLALPPPFGAIAFPVLVAAELLGPVFAERSGSITPWHPAHVAERYGLFTLIVLGESVLASTVAVQQAIASHGLSAGLLVLAGGGLLLVFGLWWTYFKRPAAEALRTSDWWAFVWGTRADHDAYVAERLEALRRRAGIAEDIAEITGHQVDVEQRWSVPGMSTAAPEP